MKHLAFFLALLLIGCSSTPSTKKEFKRTPGALFEECAYFRMPADSPIYIGTSEGIIKVEWGEKRTFSLNIEEDEYTRSGGWYWRLGEPYIAVDRYNLNQRCRIRGATKITITRDKEGNIEWKKAD